MKFTFGTRHLSIKVEKIGGQNPDEAALAGASDREVERMSHKRKSTYESRLAEAALIGGFHI